MVSFLLSLSLHSSPDFKNLSLLDLPRSAGLDDRLPGNHPRIRDEKAPFPSQRTELSFEQEQEHQFEHWYRGEGRDGGGRNGGIGEIKVGTREMLQIAVAGHQSGTLERRRAAGWVNDAEYSISGRSIGRAQTDELVWEINNRDSRVFDDSAELQRWERVLDETPLTDVDADVTDVDMGPAANHREVEEARSVTPALQVPLERKAPTTPTNKSNGIADPTTPRQPATATVKPSLSVRNGSGPSPKAKPAVRKPKPPPKRSVVESSLSPRGDLLADAIPSVSLPSITSGNWDEVVLPTVARKIHLQKLADGSLTEEELRAHNGRGPPQPQREEVIPPAPGTFGYDASKIRTPRILGGEIQMDEFGARTLYEEDEPAPLPTPPSAPPPPVLADDRPIRPLSMDLDRPESPAPFSSYVIPDQRMFALEERGSKAKLKGLKKNKPAITVTSPSQEPETMTFVREEKGEEHVGCCARCVIM